jgi:DNA-binding transcriptional LysR family regulator
MNPAALITLLPDMAVFVRVVDAGSFSGAAAQLGVTPSSVSRSIARLEKALATRLLERSTRKLRISESGQEVVQRCREMTLAAAGAVAAAGRFVEAPHGLVRISAPTDFAKTVIHPLIPDFLRRYPEVQVQLLLTDRPIDPLEQPVDLVISITDDPPKGLAARRLMAVRQILCASRAYLEARGYPAHPRDLAGHDCIYLGETAEDNRWRFKRSGETATVTVSGRYLANHVEARLEAAQQDLGVASVPDFTLREQSPHPELIQVLPEWEFAAPAYDGHAWLLYPPNRFLPPKARVLIDHLAQQLEHRL